LCPYPASESNDIDAIEVSKGTACVGGDIEKALSSNNLLQRIHDDKLKSICSTAQAIVIEIIDTISIV
jgi:hypothetical protein